MTPNDLDPLSPELQALLDAERPLTAAPAAAKSRLLAKLSTELFDVPGGDGGGSDGGSSSGGTSGGPSSGTGPASAPTGGVTGAGVSGAGVSAAGSGLVAKAVVAKLVVGASVASMAVGGAIGAGVHSAVVEERERDRRVTVPERVPDRPPEPPSPPPVVVAEPPSLPSTPVVIPPVTAPARPQLSADEQLALEKSYVEQARVAMARQDPNGALEALAQHQRRFPNGQLTEERMALEVMALSSAGRSIEARNAANAFRKRFPNGLLRSAVDATAPE